MDAFSFTQGVSDFCLGCGYVLAGVLVAHALGASETAVIRRWVGGSVLLSAAVLVTWPVSYTVAIALSDDSGF